MIDLVGVANGEAIWTWRIFFDDWLFFYFLFFVLAAREGLPSTTCDIF